MGQIIHKKMSLFEAGPNTILAHACNAKGAWGAGIALEFKKRFPEAYKEYKYLCAEYPNSTGDSFRIKTKTNSILCLITSKGYYNQLDSKEKILKNTEKALMSYCEIFENGLGGPSDKVIYSNKFNSGLFRVPWEETEAILQKIVDLYDLTWIVCDL